MVICGDKPACTAEVSPSGAIGRFITNNNHHTALITTKKPPDNIGEVTIT